MWVLLAIVSALCLGFYDVTKKLSLRANNVLAVLFLNTLFCSLLMSPVIISGIAVGDWGLGGTWQGHAQIIVKAVIVLSSWLMGYFSIKQLPLTIAGPINASRPVMVLAGALLIFGERLNLTQWAGVLLGFFSLFFISRIGRREGFAKGKAKWLWLSIGAAFMGAVSALYDKYLMGSFKPLEVQAWYTLYQFIIMGATIVILARSGHGGGEKLKWRFSILLISVFLTIADLAYFYALSQPEAMVAVVSMIRRGSVVVSFFYGVIALHEKNVRRKVVDLCILLAGLVLLVVGSM